MSSAMGEPPVFVTKLLAMIEDQSNNDLIAWAPKGETFIVTDADRLAENELPKYFKHSNFTSLVRQLNMYGFHKVTNAGGVKTLSKDEPQIWEFVHPCVQKGRPDLLGHVKRKENASTKKRMAKDDASGVMTEMMVLREQHLKMKHKFDTVQKQNEALWKEIAEHRHRHAQQQWKIERIMKYINALYVHGEAGAAFNMDAKKGRTMSAPPMSTPPAGTDAADGSASMMTSPTTTTAAAVTPAATRFHSGPVDAQREANRTPFDFDSVQRTSSAAKQLVIPALQQQQQLHPHHSMNMATGGSGSTMTTTRDTSHDVQKTLESHLGQYDAHLGRHEAHLERHLDDHFMASIFNPPHGTNLLTDDDPFKHGDFTSTMDKSVDRDHSGLQRGVKREAEEMSSDDDLLNAMEIFTPLHDFISDAVVPE